MIKYKKKGLDYLDIEKFTSRAELVQELKIAWKPQVPVEKLGLDKVGWRICAESLRSLNTLPVNRVAGPDGIAVRFEDFKNGPPDTSGWKEGQDFAPADCGDDFPDAFDTVINIERVSFDREGVISLEEVENIKKGQMLRERGANFNEGEEVARPGMLLTPFRVNILASAGIQEVPVKRKPLVGYIPTGSELIEAGKKPKRGENIETNSIMAAHTLSSWGADIKRYPIVKDNKSSLEEALDKALAETDLVLLSGGSSMGTEDFGSALLQKKSSFFKHGVRCIPGMPLAASIIDNKPAINMPGPPFASFCALDWCVQELIAHWYGTKPRKRASVEALLAEDLQKPEQMEMYYRFQLLKNIQGFLSAVPISMASRTAPGALNWDALWVAPLGESHFKAGTTLTLELMEQ